MRESITILEASLEIEDKLHTESSFNGSIKSYLKILIAAALKWEIFRKHNNRGTTLREIPHYELAIWALHYFETQLDFLYGIPSQKRIQYVKQPQGP